MPIKIAQLTSAQPDSYSNALVKNRVEPNDTDYTILVNETSTYLKPNGEPLLTLIRGALPFVYCRAGYDALHDVLSTASGSKRPEIANSSNAGSEGVLGYMDSVYPLNYCRTTALTNQNVAGYQAAYPMIRAAGDTFAEYMPERHAAQAAFCRSTHPDYVIPNTPFTTVTVNRDVTARYHTDMGDLKAGFGVIAATWAARGPDGWVVVTKQPVEGGLLVFPKFRVAVTIQTGDLLLCDVHECHGVTPIVGEPGSWARLSWVFYVRENMIKCGSLEEERQRVSLADTKSFLAKRSL